MADVYELNTIADLLKVPADSLDACLRDLRYALELCHLAGGEDTPTMAFNGFTWTDDGQHNIDMSMNGEPFLKLNVTDDAALSHAAGQEAVIPEVVRTAPERIWLQVADDTYYAGEPFPDTADAEITWCQDSVMSVEVKYIRADLVPAVARSEGEDVSEADIDAMRDVYMSHAQREAYDRILAAAKRPVPA